MAAHRRGAVRVVGAAGRAELWVSLLRFQSHSLERDRTAPCRRFRSSLVDGPSGNDVRGSSPLLGQARTTTSLLMIVCQQPNKRLKLAARVHCGMNLSLARRSLSAIR